MSINAIADRRCEISRAPSNLRSLAESVAIVFDKRLLHPRPGGLWWLETVPSGLRPSQRFAEQQRVPGAFSGFLVADRLLLTTKHDVGPAHLLAVVFSYHLGSGGSCDRLLASPEIFEPKELHGVLDPDTGEDWLLLQLDKPSRRSFPPVSARDPTLATPVVTIGHPLGLPQKFSGEAPITAAGYPVFECQLDASIGCSGSMVLTLDGTVAGALKGTAPGVDLRRGTWLSCPSGAHCPTLVTSSRCFLPAIQAAAPDNAVAATCGGGARADR